MRLPRTWATPASVLALASIAALTGTAPAAQAAVDSASYSPTIGVTAGTNAHSQVPITLDLPAPGDGIRVAQVTFSWDQPSPTVGTSQIVRLTVATPECVADQDCIVERTLSTSRMVNKGTRPLGIIVSDGTQLLGSTSVHLNVNNPKPSASFTVPADNTSTEWGTVTLTADASPGAGGVPLAGVRLYAHSTGRETDAYVFDDTAPYTVQVPATDIATPGGYGYVYAIAEDIEGNLTPVTYSGTPPTQPMQRRITVGPPAEVAFTTPVADDVAIGSTAWTAGSWDYAPLLRWTAKVPDLVADVPTGDPYIKRVQVLIDGNPWQDMPYDTISWYSATAKPRAIDFGTFWQPDGGLTPGSHTAQLRVTTSYGSIAVTERRFVVNDGVNFSPVLDAGREVRDGYVVTAGTSHRFTETISGKVDHAALTYWNMTDASSSSYVDGANGCTVPQQWDCPSQVTVHSNWSAPTTPGRYVLTWQAQPLNDKVASMTRTVVVQARGAMSALTSTPMVHRGRRATVTGRFTRTDTRVGVRGVKTQLQWRREGTTTWATLTSTTTDTYGRATAHPLRRSTGSYRWVAAGISGTASPASSGPVRVKVVS